MTVETSKCGPSSVAMDASLVPSPGTPDPPSSYSTGTASLKNIRKRDLGERQDSNIGTPASGSSLGRFSYAPATCTTVVTTTTTTTTSLPPLHLKAPRSTRDLDPKLYPLASSPTPASLRKIKFELGGQSLIFDEPEDTKGVLQELQEQRDALRASNGVLRSVTTYDSPNGTVQPRCHHPARLSRHPMNHPASAKHRPMSPVSLSEAAPSLQRTRSLMIPSESGPARSHGKSSLNRTMSRHPSSTVGLATPDIENNRFHLGESSLSKKKVHDMMLSRSEKMRFPIYETTDAQDTLQTPDQSQRSGKENMRSVFLRHERTPLSQGHPLPDPEMHSFHTSSDSLVEDLVESAGCSREKTDEQSIDTALEGPASVTSSLTDIDTADGQDMCLPSPSLSPIATLNSHNPDSSFDLTEDQSTDTDSTFDNHPSELPKGFHLEDVPAGGSNPLAAHRPRLGTDGRMTPSASLMDIPVMLDFFDSVPDEMKTYLMYQLLRRCRKPTLQFVADVVNPALKCDFLALLPTELSLSIVKYFDVQTMCRAAQVSKKWRHIINSDERAWKELFVRDGYVLTDGELQRAIREGWGWQFPCGKDAWEKDLSTSIIRKSNFENHLIPVSSSPSSSSPSSSFSASVSPLPTGPAAVGNALLPASSRRPKRKAATRSSTRKVARRKIASIESDSSDHMDWKKGVASIEGPYAAANAAAAAVPYPEVGLPSLRSLHLYKSLYRRHHAIHKGWMQPRIKPKHIAFRAHDRHVVTCLQFDSDKILTGSDDTNINVYDTQTGELRATLGGHDGGVWALEYYGNTLVSGSTDRSVRVWDIENAKCTQIFQGHTSTVRCLQIVLPVEIGRHADGTREMMPKEPLIITGSRDSNLRVWKLPKPGDPVYYQTGLHGIDSDCPYFVRALAGHTHSVRAIAAYGDTLVSGSYDCSVRVWKISTGETVHMLQGHALKVYSVVLDHERNRCISGSMDNMVKVWSLETGSLLYNLEGHTSLVGLLDLKDDRLVSAAADSTLRIWDPETGHCKRILRAHTGAITCFQHDGQKLISGSDRNLKMWNVQTGECVKDLLIDLSGVWQVRFNDRRCVAAVQRNDLTYIEVLDFGAHRDGVPEHRLGKRMVVDIRGIEANEVDDIDYEASDD